MWIRKQAVNRHGENVSIVVWEEPPKEAAPEPPKETEKPAPELPVANEEPSKMNIPVFEPLPSKMNKMKRSKKQ